MNDYVTGDSGGPLMVAQVCVPYVTRNSSYRKIHGLLFVFPGVYWWPKGLLLHFNWFGIIWL